MSFSDIQGAIRSCGPYRGKCDVCGTSIERAPSVSAGITVLLRRISKHVCLMCMKEIRALVDLRITQAEKGEYQ